MSHWQLAPGPLLGLIALGVLYGARARTLSRRGRPVPRRRAAAFAGGLIVTALALLSPIDWYGENRLLWVHMGQHLLLGDLAPLLLVGGLTGPLLRPVLARAPASVLRAARALAHPGCALPLWTLDFALWHVPAVYDAALAHPALHALEHACFLASGAAMWAAVLEPLPGPRWFGSGAKALYTLLVRTAGTAISMVFIWAGGAIYPAYGLRDRIAGIGALDDQRIAGLVMFSEGSVVTMVAFAVLFMRWHGELESRQLRVERMRTAAAAPRPAPPPSRPRPARLP